MENNIQKLTRYAEKQGFEVYMGTTSVVKFQRDVWPANKPNTIEIRKHSNKTYEVYDLLHELGHYKIRKNWMSYEKAYPLTVHAEQKHFMNGIYKYKRRIGYKIESLKEECAAWDKGLKLAHKQGIAVNEEDYRRYANSMLADYVRYYGASLTY
jgi:hypothetical protein